nr:MAG: ORF1 [Torque teno virus]
MAWGWWWRRRRWRPRRRWRTRRRRRVRPRRRRPAPRHARRRRVRRWRWRRGWRRRQYLRRRRRLKRKKKINITQWNPSTVKKCVIRGYLPLIICGTSDSTGTVHRNYASHANDYVQYDPFGGGMCTMLFTLGKLFEEYTKHHNRWSHSNVDLELVRYRGARLTLYRNPETDFILTYNRKGPFTDSQLTGASLHPGMLMNQRKKILIPSLQTKPKGRKVKRITIKPPTLYTDKWYFQSDFYNIGLTSLGVTTANLRFPFCSPQTNNICTYFQVLSPRYNVACSIDPTYLKTNYDNLLTYIEQNYDLHPIRPRSTTAPTSGFPGTVFNTFKTQEHIVNPKAESYKQTIENGNYYTKVQSVWGDHVYKKSIVTAMKQNAQNMYDNHKQASFQESQYLNFKTGYYSSIFLTNGRLSPDFKGLYTEVMYNPNNDRGVGNKVWIDWCTKNDSTWRDRPGALTVSDIPLWAAFYGYADYCKKYYNDPGLLHEVRVVVRCPYTEPPLTDADNTDMGFMAYDYNFGKGIMPDGNGYIPVRYRFHWYLCMFHQQNFMEDIVRCGPFAYKGENKSAVLMCKYKFNFLFGGNPIPQQTLKDPSKQPTFPLPVPGGGPPRLQIANPKHLNEGFYFKAWDLRRGLFGQKAIKRMQEQPFYAEFFAGPPKRPRWEVPAMAAEDDFDSRERKPKPYVESSQEETETEAEAQEETQTLPQTEQLRIQLREQKLIKLQLQHLFKQLLKTQVHLHAPIIPS